MYTIFDCDIKDFFSSYCKSGYCIHLYIAQNLWDLFQIPVFHLSFLFQSHFISALTVVFVNSKSLSSLKIDDTPVDDPSLKVLVANNSDTLKLLKMSSCPHVSPAGKQLFCLL